MKKFSPLRHLKKRISALGIVYLQLLTFGFCSHAFANQEFLDPPWSFLDHHREHILQLSSDDAALALFQSIVPPNTQTSRTRRKSPPSSKKNPLSEEVRKAVIHYLASLAVTAHTQTIKKNTIRPTPATSSDSETFPGNPQLQWMAEQPPLQTMKSLMEVHSQVMTWSQAAPEPHPSGPDYGSFAAYYDQTYPDWDENPSSWTNLYLLQGSNGIEARLLEFWQTPDHPDPASSATKNAYAHHYIRTRLLPIFRAYLLTESLQLEALAYESAWKAWQVIQEWQQKKHMQSAANRLCGTWQWLVHNHQNHGNHKMMVTFSSGEPSSPSQPQPTIMAIQGDTVFLKWTFPQGFQEDSLLLSNNDTHLEGTFKNTLGPHGSISGKRISSCQ